MEQKGGVACEHCTKWFKYPSLLRRHQQAKRKCLPAAYPATLAEEKAYACRFCGLQFTTATSRNRHVRLSCRAPVISAKPPDQDKASQEERMAMLEAQNAEILSLLRKQQEASSSSTTQIIDNSRQTTVNQTVNQMVHVNVFGEEKLDHVTAERIKAILDECLQRPALPTAVSEAVLKTAMLVYSDPDRPENLTAYLPNKKTKDALVHTKAGWEVQPTQLVLPPMALKSIDTIFGRQPPEDEYAPLLKELQQNEARFAAGEDLHPILVRNKDLLARALATLPVAGS